MSAGPPDPASVTEELRQLHAAVAELEQQTQDARRSERRLAARDAVTSALSESSSLADAASRILRAICETLEWHMGALWVVEQGVLRSIEVWHAPHPGIPKFAVTTHAHTFARGEGLPARDAYLTVLRQAFDRTGEGEKLQLYFGATSGELFGSGDAGQSWFTVAARLPPVYSVTAAS